MKPFIILLGTFCISLIVLKFTIHQFDFSLAARIAMCVLLCFTAIGHFAFSKGMSMMIPDFIPFKTELVYFTGILEIFLGISLLIPDLRFYAGWILIVFFVLILPANIKASIDKLNYEKGNYDGNGLNYLWFRIPLQIFFIIWTFISAIKF